MIPVPGSKEDVANQRRPQIPLSIDRTEQDIFFLLPSLLPVNLSCLGNSFSASDAMRRGSIPSKAHCGFGVRLSALPAVAGCGSFAFTEGTVTEQVW